MFENFRPKVSFFLLVTYSAFLYHQNMEAEWIQICKDWSLVLLFTAIFGFIVYRTVKSSPPENKSASPGGGYSAGFTAQRSGNINEITAAITAAVNEYRKNNS